MCQNFILPVCLGLLLNLTAIAVVSHGAITLDV